MYYKETWYKKQTEEWRKIETKGWIGSIPPGLSPNYVGLSMINYKYESDGFMLAVPKNQSPQKIHTGLLNMCKKRISLIEKERKKKNNEM